MSQSFSLNPFFIFLSDFRSNLDRDYKDYKFQSNLIVSKAGEVWRSMYDSDKKIYHEKAKANKISRKSKRTWQTKMQKRFPVIQHKQK